MKTTVLLLLALVSFNGGCWFSKLTDDLKDPEKAAFSEAINNDPELIPAYKELAEAGIADVTNLTTLNRTKGNIDDIVAAGGYKEWVGSQIPEGLEYEQFILNKYPDEAIPEEGVLWGVAEVENGKIKPLGVRGDTFTDIDFVVTLEGNMKLGQEHHFLGNAESVQAAGTFKITHGKIKRISNDSGHYFPSIEEAEKYPDILRNMGFDINGASLEVHYLDEVGEVKTYTKLINE